jgi:hypothetical protein
MRFWGVVRRCAVVRNRGGGLEVVAGDLGLGRGRGGTKLEGGVGVAGPLAVAVLEDGIERR